VQRLFRKVIVFVSAGDERGDVEEGQDDARTKRKERERRDDGAEKI
jgi:hypothetical protein